MSDRVDRRIGSSGQTVAVIVISVLLALGAGVFFWRHGHGPADGTAPGSGITAPLQRPDEPVTVIHYYPDNTVLTRGTGTVKRQPEVQALAKDVLAGLLNGQPAQSPLLKNTQIRGLFLDAEGTAYVDLAAAPEPGVRASAWDELLALYAMVNTLTENFEEIKQVRFLVDGREAQTLTGHIDLSQVFTKRMDLVQQ